MYIHKKILNTVWTLNLFTIIEQPSEESVAKNMDYFRLNFGVTEDVICIILILSKNAKNF